MKIEENDILKKIKKMNIAIIGLGVIGAAFAESLRNISVEEIYGIDTDKETLKKAKEKGFIKNKNISNEEILNNADLIVLSLYPNSIKKFILENKENFKKNVIITDVVGIKSKMIDELTPIIDEINKKYEKEIDFIFGHPMAGREKRGIDFADASVFKNANYILINEKNKKENIEIMKKLIEKMGFRSISFLTAKEHDEIIAYTSQLTHAIAVALVNSDSEKYETNKFIGDSFRDLTRIAKINEDLWSELFLGNKENLLKMIVQFEYELDEIKMALRKNDIEVLKEKFKLSTKRREKID